MVESLGYMWSVVVLVVCVQASQPVLTINLPPQLSAVPLTTTNTTNTSSTIPYNTADPDSEVVEYVSITPYPLENVSTIVPLNNSDNGGRNVENLQSETSIKANDSIHKLYNKNTGILSINKKGNEEATTSTTADYEVSPIMLDVTTESSMRGNTDANDPVASEMKASLLPNDSSHTTHIEIPLDAQDATTEGIEERTEVFKDSRTDTTPRNGTLPPQNMSTESNTREGKDNTTTDKNVTGRTQSNNTEEMNGTAEALRNTTEVRKLELVDGRVPTYSGQLVKCQCGAKEVLTKDGCQSYPSDTFINSENSRMENDEVRNYFSVTFM